MTSVSPGWHVRDFLAHGTIMRAILLALAVTFAVYSAAVYLQAPRGDRPVANNMVRDGMDLWQRNNCQSCHQFYGLGGYMGPDLTNVSSRCDENRIRAFIRYGTGRMPAHALTENDLDALVAFLAWVDSSGTSHVPDSAVHWSGTYLIDER